VPHVFGADPSTQLKILINPQNELLAKVNSGNVSQEALKSHSEDEGINRYYDKYTQTFTLLELTSIDELYMDNAVYISETQHRDIVQGKQNILALYQSFFDKIRRKQARIEVDFRVNIRKITEHSATDIGYYLVRFYPQADTGEPVSEFAGKFVNVFIKHQGKWQISVDSNTRADPRFYFAAKPIQSLYYGQRFLALSTARDIPDK
jgi:hypothetical protein